jgi:hypothetical protein
MFHVITTGHFYDSCGNHNLKFCRGDVAKSSITAVSFLKLHTSLYLICSIKTSSEHLNKRGKPDFLSSGGSGTGSTQPREVN